MTIAEQPKVIETPIVPQEESVQDVNWKNFREKRALERKQAEEAEQARIKAEKEAAALKEAMEALLTKSQPQQNREDLDETEEQRIARMVRQQVEAIESERRRLQAEEDKKSIPAKVASIHADFYQVCSQENIDWLEHHRPELFRSIRDRPESVEKYADAYKIMKQAIPNPDSTADKKRVEANLSKPQSIQTSAGPMKGDGTIYGKPDEAKRAARWAEMQRIIKGG